MKTKLKAFFEGKKVLILGFGREGKSTLELLKQFDCEIGISDKNLEITDEIKDYALYTGENYLASIADYDIIMKSPGVILLDRLNDEAKAKITSQTDLLLRFCQNKIIGVTGTKGKSTTSSLVYHILGKCGFSTMLIGNIGVPPLQRIDEFTDNTVIVCEMSCHQLEYVKASPDIAVLLNIYEEHLDHYVNFDAYAKAKRNIYAYQNNSDTLIYNIECEDATIVNAICNKISASSNGVISDIYIDGETMHIPCAEIPLSRIKTSLIGKHNLYNIAVALTAAVVAGCELNAAISAVESFNGLEHRLEYVGKVNGVEYINDSISTIPLAAINALKAFDNVDTLIVGGMDRGISYSILVDFLRTYPLKNLILLKDSGYRVGDMLGDVDFTVYRAADLADAVDFAAKNAVKRCVLSPAAASYGFYKNFEERGKHFKELVNNIK